MSKKLNALVQQAKKVKMSDPEKAEQRISFAYGSANIENQNITKEMVERIARKTTQKLSNG